MNTKKLWVILATVITLSFAVLIYYGVEIYREAPPIPKNIISASGEVIFTETDIKDGQNIWQSTGGQELGTIWGHGSYVAPDWSADWLHRESEFILNDWSMAEFGKDYKSIGEENKSKLTARLQGELRTNTHSMSNNNIIVSDIRAKAIAAISEYYKGLFMGDPKFDDLRNSYAMMKNTITEESRMKKLNAFFFWTSWVAVTNRPGEEYSYTNNWPSEELVGNRPTGSLIIWTGFSVILLLAGIGLMGAYYAKNKGDEMPDLLPKDDPMLGVNQTSSMKATLKYFWVVSALLVVQIISGIVTAHYGVEGNGFYGFELSEIFPYSITRTWHVQLGIFWIATSWLATGLYIAPVIAGKEPKFQSLGVNFLFLSLLVIVVGSLIGQWMSIMQKLNLVDGFWFGHQGYEYVDLGRFWQIYLLVGLFLWLFLVGRAIIPAIKKQPNSKSILTLFVISAIAIAGFYAAGLMWGRQTHLAIAEYWRWWVVHLWVEGFFEVFATVLISYLFVRLGLIKEKTATHSVLFATIIFLSGGIIGTFHHLYFTGTPTSILALGASFSALEVVPLVFIGFEAFHSLKLSNSTTWMSQYKWPIYFFISVSFWNLVGAGIFGFLINPPIALYYMQGLNTTPVHGHTALFGVYGMLGLGLMLFVLRVMNPKALWKNSLIKFAFWSLNIGLLLMVLLSVLPIGLLQTIASVDTGMWYARSAEFMQQDHMNVLRWLRLIGDTVFAFGAIAVAWFVFGLKGGWSILKDK